MPHHPNTPQPSKFRGSSASICDRLPLVEFDVMIGSRSWTMCAVQNQDALVDLTDELEHLPYGFLLWESALGLARHLYQRPETVAGKRILELGCGLGLPGLVARTLGGNVTQTDHQPGVLALAGKNASANNVEGVDQVLADWRDWRIRSKFELLIGADILYDREMHHHLETIFTRSISPGGTLLVADPGRPQSMEFMAGLEKSGWQIDVQTTNVRLDHEGSEARMVEVAIMSAQLVS
jgi:predicted nicotinamide N-methyase